MKKTSQPSLFSAPKAAANALVARIDGGARGNPGPAGYGVVIESPKGEKLAELSRHLGHRTNNFAEYSALLATLEYCLAQKHRVLRVLSDSELLVRQMKGIYKVKSPDLRPLYERARQLSRQLDFFSID